MTEEQLLSHAARCTRLAEKCLDPLVARKLRALARDYEDFAKQQPERPTTHRDAPIEPSPVRRLASA